MEISYDTLQHISMNYALFIGIATYLIVVLVLKSNKNKQLPPSPRLSFPIIGHLYLLKQPLHRSLAKISSRYGPIVYLQLGARPTLLVSSPSGVEECLIKNHVFLNRPRLLPSKHSMFNYPSIPWTPQGAEWRNLRKIAAVELLSPQRLQTLSGIRASVARSFIRRTMKEKNPIIEMKSSLFGLTLDNMMRMLVGKSSYEGEHDEKTLIRLRRYQDLVEESFRRSGVSNMEDFLPFLKMLKVFQGKNSAEEMIKKVTVEKEEFMLGLMEDHRKMDSQNLLTETQQKSMLHVMLNFQQKDPQFYTDEMIGSLLLTLFQGGTDTSASTTVWVLSLLLNHPEVLKKAQDEMDKIVGHERLVEESDKKNLPYLQSIINETFRMFPTGQLALPYEAEVDCLVGGYHVPRGSMLLYNIWGIHNDPKIWPEPRKFKPERFLSLQDEGRKGYDFMPFGTGKRICPGEHLATRVIWVAVAILIQCFEWERVDDKLVNLTEGVGLTLAKRDPLFAKCRPRPCMIKLLSEL